MEQPASGARLPCREDGMTPSTPPAAGLAECASDPESAGARRRARRGGIPATRNGGGLRMKVGKRGWGGSSAKTSTSSAAGVAYDDAAADIGIGARAAAAAAHDGKGAGGARRQSAGSRLGALLRRGAPTLNNLRSYRGGSGGKNLESKGAADLGLPVLGISPPPELEDPPEGHHGYDDSRAGGAGAEAGGGSMSSSSGRRRLYKSRSAVGGSSRNSGHARAGASPEDPLDSSGGGGGGGVRLRRASSYSKFARKKNDKALDADYDDQVAFWSGSELARGVVERRQTSPASAAANARRDRSAPPSGRVPSGIRRDPPPAQAEPVGAEPPRGGGGTGATKPAAAARSPADVRRLFPDDDDDVGEGSTREEAQQRQGPANAADPVLETGGTTISRAKNKKNKNKNKNKKTRRRIVDGYMSAPEVCSSDTADRRTALEVDECIARAEAALFAIDTTSDAEVGGDCCDQEQASSSSDGEGGGAALSSRGSSARGRAAAAAASADAPAAAAAGGRLAATTSKRRRFTELLLFRRRSSSGAGSPGALALSVSTAAGDGGVSAGGSYDGSVLQNSNSSAASGAALGAAATGAKASLRRGSATASANPRRKMLHRANSTSALDRVAGGGREEEEEDYSAAAAAAAAAAGRKPAASSRRRVGTRRRLLPGGSSAAAAGRGVSVSPERHRRHRESFLEAGKDKLRRGRSKLSRGAFGTRSSSQRAAAPGGGGDASREDSPSGGNAGGEAEAEMEVEAAKKEKADGVGEPTIQGPPAKPQLGTTYTKRPDTPPLDPAVGAPWNTWGHGSGSQFNVRTKGYGRTKVKAPSAPELYELASIDAYRSPAGRICGVYPMFTPPACIAAGVNASVVDPRADSTGQTATPARASGGAAEAAKEAAAALGGAAGGNADPATGANPVRIGEVKASRQGAGAGGGGGGDAGGGTGHPDIPPVLVVNCQLPDIPAPFSGQGDGPTVHVIFTFHATRRLRRYAARVWADENAAASAAASAAAVGGGDQAAAAASETAPPGSGAHSGGLAASGVSGDAATSGDSLLPQQSGGCEGATVAAAGGGQRASGTGGGADEDGGGGEAEDGDGDDVPESVRLLVEWMRRAEDDGNFRGRFKAIGDIVNADEVGLPSMFARFSGKPILLYGKESNLVTGPGFAELDLNAHAFSYVGRKGLYVTLDKWKQAIFRIGFLLEGRSDEEQPEHMLGCGVFYGLDISNLSELAPSPDGKRLIVTNPDDDDDDDKENVAVSDLNGSSAAGRGVPAAGGAPALDRQVSCTSSSSSSSSAVRHAPPPQPLLSGQRSASRVAASSYSSSSSSSSSSRVPLVRRRHMASLLRSHGVGGEGGGGGGGGNGDVDTPTAAAINAEKAFFGDRAVVPRDEDDVTVTAVAAAAFAGGWFCALLAIITVACWSEFSVTGGRVEGGGGRLPAGVSAWLVRVFADP